MFSYSIVMGYPILLMIRRSSMARYYCDNHLILDTTMSSMKSPTVESTQYGSGNSEIKSVPSLKTQLPGIGNSELQTTDATRRAAGY